MSGPSGSDGERCGSVTWRAGRLCMLAESRMLAEGLPEIGDGALAVDSRIDEGFDLLTCCTLSTLRVSTAVCGC